MSNPSTSQDHRLRRLVLDVVPVIPGAALLLSGVIVLVVTRPQPGFEWVSVMNGPPVAVGEVVTAPATLTGLALCALGICSLAFWLGRRIERRAGRRRASAATSD
jgi:hypothetical protein